MRRAKGIFFLIALLLLCVYTRPVHAVAARINGISDLTPPNWTLGSGDITGHIDVCIYAAGLLSSGNYIVTVSGNGLLGFSLTSGVRSLAYQLYWDGSGSGHLGNGGTQLLNTIPLIGQTNASSSDNSCPGGPNARLNLKILAADLTAAIAGTYTGIVTILIAPT